MGILCSKAIPALPVFPIYIGGNHYTVNLVYQGLRNFTKEELLLIQQAHYTIFLKVLEFPTPGLVFQPMIDSTENLLFSPLLSLCLSTDWQTIKRLVQPDAFLREDLVTLQTRFRSAEGYANSVVATWSTDKEGKEERFLVTAVRQDLNSYSVVSKKGSPVDIFLLEHGIKLLHPTQPLIEVVHCSKT